MGNPFSLRQILQNLITNAFSHGEADGGAIEVSCMEEDGFWRFTVSDHGPGVPPHVLERLLHPESVPATPTTGERGSGIGLNIVQKHVMAHGGVMAADGRASAMALLSKNRFDAVVADYQLGDGTALDLFPGLGNMPIVITTGKGGDSAAVKSLRAGAFDCLLKDLDASTWKRSSAC